MAPRVRLWGNCPPKKQVWSLPSATAMTFPGDSGRQINTRSLCTHRVLLRVAEAFSSSDKLPSGSGKLLRAALQLDNQEDIELGLHHCRLFPSKGICRGHRAGVTQAGGRAGAARQQEPPSAMLTTSDTSVPPPPKDQSQYHFQELPDGNGTKCGPRMVGYRCSTESCLGDACLQALPCFTRVPYPLPSPVTSCLSSSLTRCQSALRPVLSVPQPPDLSTAVESWIL